ncbi:MAG: potassium channel protein [Gammaproteobacteria bacterium]|nr:potassium channel protein [Gammaproteobacteria bacterium]
MKYLGSVLAAVQREGGNRQNFRLVLTYLAFLGVLITFYSVIFHVIMAMEGQKHSWLTGFYWTLTVMSTLGFGDITFQSDAGRAFSILVLVSGIVSLLVILPFLFIEFFYVPFLAAQKRARAPRMVSDRMANHVILTSYDPVTVSLIGKLNDYGYPYVLIVDNTESALELVAEGLNVMVGDLDDPQTYVNARLEQAALVVATGGDIINTNTAFTVRELDKNVRIIATARDQEALDIVSLAGSTRVLKLGEMLGTALARRTIAGDARAHVIGEFDDLVIAEATAAATPLVGKTLAGSKLEQSVGIHVIGTWERGRFLIATPDTAINEATVLVLAGTREQVNRYNALFCIYHVARGRVLILGSGRVGRATAHALQARGVEYCLVDKYADRLGDIEHGVVGNATDRKVLDQAGINEAPAVMVTTHDDDINIYLTIYARRLRPDSQIISRATLERNVSTMHRAGADFVMSYASMGASAIFNYLERGDILMLAEGLNVSRVKVPPGLVGKTLAERNLFEQTGCHLVALGKDRHMDTSPDLNQPLTADMTLVIVGNLESEKRFLNLYARN